MTKKNLIITIILLAIIDLVAAAWYISRSFEVSGKAPTLFDQRDSTETIVEADTIATVHQNDEFEDLQHNTYYFIANTPSIQGDNTSRYTSIKHVKVRWPKKVNGDESPTALNKELISKAFGNSQDKMKEARYVYLNTPSFNKPIGDDYQKLSSAPTIVPVYGNVSQVLVYPYMTSHHLLVMEIDKVEYNGTTTTEDKSYIHYDRSKGRILKRLDILVADVDKENKLLKVINKKIDELNKRRGDDRQLQHALNVPAEICCGKKGILFDYKHGTISSQPIEILIEYDKLEPFMTEEFKQMVESNEGYTVFEDDIKPEPINPTKQVAPAVSAVPAVKKASSQTATATASKKQYKHKNSGYYKKPYYTKPKRTNRKRYNGARRRSGYHGSSGRLRSTHRRR